MRALHVYRDEHLVGTLRDTGEDVEFEYAAGYLANQPQPISASLPLDPSLIRGARVRAYFGNLLPEGDLRDALSARLKVDSGDDVGLLQKIGADSAGALVILPEGEKPQPADAPFEQRYLPLEDAYDFGQYIDALRTSPVAAFKGVPTRMSLAGVQNKTVLARFYEPRLYRCTGGASTHIVKIGSRLNQKGEEEYQGLVFNEYFCSKLAQACGLALGQVEMLPYQTFRDGPPEYVFAIERYDRIVHGNTRQVERLHQEDFCQALGRPRTQKYETNTGVKLTDMFQFIQAPEQIALPVVSQKRLLQAVLFNLIIGNRDSHAKNYSLLRNGAKAELAPLYDLVCTEIYENIDQSLPQKIGDARLFAEINGADLEQMAASLDIRLSTVNRELMTLSRAVLHQMPIVIHGILQEPIAEQAMPVVEKVNQVVARNAGHLLRDV